MDYPKYSGRIIRVEPGRNNSPYGVFRGVNGEGLEIKRLRD
jgi:hypothetical protein